MAMSGTVQSVSFTEAPSEHGAPWTDPFRSSSFLSGAALQQPVEGQQAKKGFDYVIGPSPPSWRTDISAP
jgi:hypothetical protein